MILAIVPEDLCEYKDFIFVCKRGCDGSSGYSEYLQIWKSDSSNQELSGVEKNTDEVLGEDIKY